jgi:hypothetical protein
VRSTNKTQQNTTKPTLPEQLLQLLVLYRITGLWGAQEDGG